MTVARPEDTDLEFETGLDDFDMEDAVVPRLTIVHPEQEFKDGLTGETFSKLNVIILGLVKQRSLWHPTVDEGDWPMCRSQNHEIGFPNLSDKQPKEKVFPWAISGFDPADYEPDPDGQIRLPCSGCQLKEWKSHPDGKKPYCSEQFTLPLLYSEDPDGPYAPAILSLQKTSLKPIKAYLTGFARSQTPAFSVITELTLEAAKRGTTTYSIAQLRKGPATDQDQWRSYAMQFRTMRDFLTADPGSVDEEEDGVGTPSANVNTPPPAKEETAAAPDEPAAKEAAVVEEEPKAPAAAAPAAANDDDDLPF